MRSGGGALARLQPRHRTGPRAGPAAGFTLEAAFLVERSPHAPVERCAAWPAGRRLGEPCGAPARWTLGLRYILLGLFATVALCERCAREVPAERVPYLANLACYVCREPATRTASCGVCHRQGEYSVCDEHQAPLCGCSAAAAASAPGGQYAGRRPVPSHKPQCR